MITKYQKFKTVTIHRGLLVDAPYNPRKINDKQRAGLRKNLKRVGIIQPIVWNENTGNIVSGHQRIAILDDLMGTNDYEIDVTCVNLDEKTEREQNVFLNSTTYTGEFDFDKLQSLINDGLDYALAGLDEYDLNIIGLDTDDEDWQDDNDNDEAIDYSDIAKRKKDSRSEIDARFEEKENYVTLSFSSFNAKSAFMLKYGFDPVDLFIKGEAFMKILSNEQN